MTEEHVTEKHMSPEAVRRMLARLGLNSSASHCWYFPPVEGAVAPDLPEGLLLPEIIRAQMLKSSTGSVFFSSGHNTGSEYNLIIPPFPVQKRLSASYLETSPLLDILEREFVIGIVLIRLGSFAIGVSKGQKLVASKVGTGLVHGRHRQGGSSANRFARHREKQIETFFTRACGYLRQYLEPYAGEIDYMLYGGARTTILDFKKQCPFIGMFTQTELPSQLDIPEPRQAVLLKSLEKAWSSRVFTWFERCQANSY